MIESQFLRAWRRSATGAVALGVKVAGAAARAANSGQRERTRGRGARRTIWAVAHDGSPSTSHNLGKPDLDLHLPDGVAALLRVYLALEGRELELLLPVLVRKLERHSRAE